MGGFDASPFPHGDRGLPPHSLEAEQSVLGALLLDNSVADAVTGVLAESDFYVAEHAHIFRAAMALIVDNKPADVITVAEWMATRGLLQRVQGGAAYLLDLTGGAMSATNAPHYAALVHERAVMRAVISAANAMLAMAFDSKGKTARQILDGAQGLLAQVDERAKRGQGTFRALGDAATEAITAIKQDDRGGVSTGISALDRMLNPLRPGELAIIGARPSVGKTSLALNIAEHAARAGVTVAMFSMEMTSVELAVRTIAGATEIPAGRFREHRLSDAHWQRIQEVMPGLHALPMHIDESGGLTIQEITARARVQARKLGGIGLLLVDYLQLAHADGRYDNRAVEIGAVTRGLKALAKELQCPVIALSQLNREAAKERKWPTISELRDSGSIESDADVILLLHRDYVSSQDEAQMFDALVIVGKQRNGGIGHVQLDYDPRLTRFYDRDHAPGRAGRDASAYRALGG